VRFIASVTLARVDHEPEDRAVDTATTTTTTTGVASSKKKDATSVYIFGFRNAFPVRGLILICLPRGAFRDALRATLARSLARRVGFERSPSIARES